jgi:hypothetical protein
MQRRSNLGEDRLALRVDIRAGLRCFARPAKVNLRRSRRNDHAATSACPRRDIADSCNSIDSPTVGPTAIEKHGQGVRQARVPSPMRHH